MTRPDVIGPGSESGWMRRQAACRPGRAAAPCPKASLLGTLALLVLTTAPITSMAAPTIYRCEQGGTTVFSDRPCDDDAEPHSLSQSISVVAAPSDLDAIAERNAAYLESQQAERASRAAARAAARAARAEAAQRTVQVVRTVPVVPAGIYGTRPTQRPAASRNRLEALRGDDLSDNGRRIPISATSGRQPGNL